MLLWIITAALLLSIMPALTLQDRVLKNRVLATLVASILPTYIAARISVRGMDRTDSRTQSKVRYYLRLSAYLGGLAFCAASGVVIASVCALLGHRENANYFVARLFYYLTGTLCGIKFRIEGKEHLPKKGESVVFVGNHQSFVDILYGQLVLNGAQADLAVGAFFPKATSIMSKRELMWTPFLGQFMWLANAVFVNRADRKSAVAQFQRISQVMKRKKTALFIFAEGTRSATVQPTLLPFKKGAFHLAVEGQMPVVPVVCENYSRRYNARAKRFEAGEIVIRVLPPIASTDYTNSSEDITSLANTTREAMLDALGELASRSDSASESNLVERDGAKALEMKKAAKKAAPQLD